MLRYHHHLRAFVKLRLVGCLLCYWIYRVLVGKPEGKRPVGRPWRRWVDNIRIDLQEVGCGYMDWIGLAQDRDRWRTLVSAVMNLRVPWNVGNFLTSCKPVSWSRRTLHHGVVSINIRFISHREHTEFSLRKTRGLMLYTEIIYSFCNSIEHNGTLRVCFGVTICATFEARLVWVWLALNCKVWGSEASKLYTFFVSSVTGTCCKQRDLFLASVSCHSGRWGRAFGPRLFYSTYHEFVPHSHHVLSSLRFIGLCSPSASERFIGKIWREKTNKM